ncbi:MAG: hypothetical protein AB8B52_14410 [Winogradskyella sp.]|uniref:hypothetical protein n=1 Tax=Winogradskyella sp. TaxID=1883156 RepID=UPI003858BD9D
MNQTNQNRSEKSIIKTLTIIHFMICAVVLVFGTVIIFITENAQINFADTEDSFFYLVPLFAICGAFVSQYLFQKLLNDVHAQATLKDKLTKYQSSKVIQYALIEAPAFLGIVICLITTNQFYLIISAALLAYLIFLRPTTATIKEDLNLNSEQERTFRELTK